MHDRELYAQILGIRSPWFVEEVRLEVSKQDVHIRVALTPESILSCVVCSKPAPRYDSRSRQWRHLDTCQFRTWLTADVPRVNCAEHGVHQIHVPWAEAGSGFTALFEAVVIDWLKEASLSAVARRMRLSWDEVDGIQGRAVTRGLARREALELRRIGVDETAFQRRQSYVTMVSDFERDRLLWVGKDRKESSLNAFWETLSFKQRAQVEAVAMDMAPAYVNSTLRHVPQAETKIAFDRFHVAQHLGEAVNEVRKAENRELAREGDRRLMGTKYLWLQNLENMQPGRRREFRDLKTSSLRVARAWAIKEAARELWSYASRGWAQRAWKAWIAWAQRSRLEPVRRAARTVRDHLWGILNAVVLGASNARSEAMAAKVQRVKKMACGFRNHDRFRNALLFHYGKLDLYPAAALTTHTTS